MPEDLRPMLAYVHRHRTSTGHLRWTWGMSRPVTTRSEPPLPCRVSRPLHLTVEDQIAKGDEVALRYRGEGTHRGEWRGIAPTGKRIRYTGILIQRFEGSKIAEFWAQPDLLGLLQQLGAIPPTGASAAHSG